MSAESARVASYPLSSLLSGIAIGVFALMILGVEPLVFGALAQEGRLNAQSLGWVSTIEVLMLAVGASAGVVHLQRGFMRVKIGGAACVLCAVNIAVLKVDTIAPLALLRLAAGLLEGYTLAAAIVVTVRAANPERLSGIFMALVAIPQAAAAYLLPVIFFPTYGANAGFCMLALLSLVSAGLALFVRPGPLAPQVTHIKTASAPVFGLAALAALAAVAIYGSACGAAWAYMERLGAERHLQSDTVGLALAASLICQLAGALGMAYAVRRFAPYTSVAIICLIQAALMVCLARSSGPQAYIGLASAFGFVWQATTPLQVKLLIGLDASRKVAMMSSPLMIIGFGAGPALASIFVTTESVSGVYWAASAAMMLTGMMYLLSAGVSARTAASAIHSFTQPSA